MYRRTKTWQDLIIASQAESGWENTITLNYPCIDFRCVLQGYGWKANASDENLVVNYKGRYDCYYRISGGGAWTKFATVISERAGYSDSNVYKDSYITLGVVAENTYEIKIVAADAEKFTAWGGTLEGISSGGQFWSSGKMRSLKPYEISVSEDIDISEFAYGGKELLEASIYSEVTIVESAEILVPYFSVYDEVTITENIELIHEHLIDTFESITITENFEKLYHYYPMFFEILSVEEYIEFLISPPSLLPQYEEIGVIETATLSVV